MALTADQITAQNFKDFYTQILPYLNKGNGGTSDTPLGQVAFFDDLVAPAGWLIADGSTYNISDYPDLANQYERVHGSKNFYGGNGTTTFAVPDWDAIPAEVFGNANIICVKAVPSSEMNTYSTTERKVGTWIDGKPVYQKVILAENLAASSSNAFAHGITNLDNVVSVFGSAKRAGGVIQQVPGTWYGGLSWSLAFTDITSTNISFQVGSSYTGNDRIVKAIAVIQYTKTTD